MPNEIAAQSPISSIADMAKVPGMTPEVLREYIAAQKEIMQFQAELDYNAAMARLQPKLPQIEKKDKAHNSKYAKLEDIDVIVRPLYTAEGFSVSYNQKKNEDGSKTYFGYLKHQSGHMTQAELTLPDDGSGSKNAIQAVASTMSYAQRYLLKMLLNIIEKGEDIDGNFTLGPIDDAQFEEIQRLIDESQTDTAAFCKHMKVESLKAITQKQYGKATNDLKAKIETLKKKGKK